MKKQLKLLLLVSLLAVYCMPALAQSTQGKEFWVSSTLVCSPDKATPTPYIAISAENACTVKIQGGIGNAINITQQVAAGSWNEFGNGTTSQTNPNAGMIKVPMDASKWYPTSMTNANNVYTLAGQKNMYGLHITATENISVYVILSSLHSMDASNILPMTAIGSEYYTQDYWSKVKSDFNDAVGLTTILGTEDGTQVDIIPNGDTYDGHQSGVPYTIDLNKGQTYYMVTKKGERLSGSHIQAKNGRKIAVYCGVPITNIPTGIAARDCLFEQSMPIDYWGTQFIVTRSLQKNGNLIGITATQRGTEIKVDGYTQSYINEGETYYIMLQGAGDPNGNKAGDSPIDLVVTQDVAYIETSCPCAVYSYDTGNSYKGKNTDEIDNGKGDPSSVWVSPIQQKIGRITFGTCYTDKTKDHFLNVVTETATCQQTKLMALYGATKLDKSNLLTWMPVPGNPTYSYARAKIGDSSTSQYSVFSLENSKGVIATVYGNGEDESYAYSAGSAAVEQGVNVEGETFTNGYRSDSKFCFGDSLEFDANVGTDEISRVDWTFGDGTTEYYGTPQTKHAYTTPGWYDVTAELYGHQVCTTEDNVWLGRVQFSFRVVRADTVFVAPKDSCLSIADQEQIIAEHGQHYLDSLVEHGGKTILNPDAPCYEDKQLSFVKFGLETETEFDSIVRNGVELNGRWYESDARVTWTVSKPHKCDQHFICNLKVITCLQMNIPNNAAEQAICPGEKLEIPYHKTKGHIGAAYFTVPGLIEKEAVVYDDNMMDGTFILPTSSLTKAGHYQGTLLIEDSETECDNIDATIDFTVMYPSDIFKFKFNNVLAVYQNKGYEFTGYQWFRNGQPVEGATGSILYLGQGVTFEEGDEVFVVLTDASGLTLPSCPQTLTDIQDYNPEEEPAPAQKKIVNRRFMIQKGNKIYDIYGQKIQ
ncbi:MAG: PKD domain-containing protein [Paludibacteraceae bacterium]|nr:PKD domain-containing protein [Paludibacteraceae bacterium]